MVYTLAGNTVKLGSSFTFAGEAVDLDSATIEVKRGGAVVATASYPGDIINDAPGHYYLPFTSSTQGKFRYRFVGSWAGKIGRAVGEVTFTKDGF